MSTSRRKTCIFHKQGPLRSSKGVCSNRIRIFGGSMGHGKFHFLYDNHFILENEQKPLEAILLKSLNQATPQLQRILIRTFSYHVMVCHILGPTNQLADCLSRLGTQNDSIKLPKPHFYQITNQLNARSDSLNQLHVAMQEDDELVLLKHTITNGWPNTIKEVPKVQAYWTF